MIHLFASYCQAAKFFRKGTKKLEKTISRTLSFYFFQ